MHIFFNKHTKRIKRIYTGANWALAGLACLLLTGCESWVPWAKSKKEASAPPQTLQAWEKPGAASIKDAAPVNFTLADKNLLQIAELEQRLLLTVKVSPETISDSERRRKLIEIAQAYDAFVLKNPQHVEALALYGKFLRRIGERERALELFLKADALDPELASVKQQIGNTLAEGGQPELALGYFLQATQLAPQEPLYAYQLGELLHTYRAIFLTKGTLTQESLEQQMLTAFTQAARLSPGNRDFQHRLGEAFYDVAPQLANWPIALKLWEALEANARSGYEADIARLHRARVLKQLNRGDEADALLKGLEVSPALQPTLDGLLAN